MANNRDGSSNNVSTNGAGPLKVTAGERERTKVTYELQLQQQVEGYLLKPKHTWTEEDMQYVAALQQLQIEELWRQFTALRKPYYQIPERVADESEPEDEQEHSSQGYEDSNWVRMRSKGSTGV